jgi:hypothetical protein
MSYHVLPLPCRHAWNDPTVPSGVPSLPNEICSLYNAPFVSSIALNSTLYSDGPRGPLTGSILGNAVAFGVCDLTGTASTSVPGATIHAWSTDDTTHPRD